MTTTVNNAATHRFEAVVGGETAFAEYKLRDGQIILTHTVVPDALEGHGVGSALAKTALAYAREQGLQVVPLCSFMAGYIERHPEYQDLVAARPGA
ncbi:GNAT family N-acetyltransferase [soil metagenome]